MKNKLKEAKNKRGMSKALIIGIMVFVLLFGIILVSALTTEEQNALQNEFNSLESELNNKCYDWTINHQANKFKKENCHILYDN